MKISSCSLSGNVLAEWSCCSTFLFSQTERGQRMGLGVVGEDREGSLLPSVVALLGEVVEILILELQLLAGL